MKDLIIASFILLALIIAFFWISSVTCEQRWDTSGRQWRWGLIAGCQVHDGKGWVPADNYRSL